MPLYYRITPNRQRQTLTIRAYDEAGLCVSKWRTLPYSFYPLDSFVSLSQAEIVDLVSEDYVIKLK